MDVDRWGEYALAIAYLDEVDDGLASMQAAVFAGAEGGWVPVGGSGGSVQLEGFALESAEPAMLQQHGRGGVRSELTGRTSRWVHHTSIRCSPAAAAVVVERGGDVRRVAVGDVALWIGVAWTDETEPIVRALDAAAMSWRPFGRRLGMCGRTGKPRPAANTISYSWTLRTLGSRTLSTSWDFLSSNYLGEGRTGTRSHNASFQMRRDCGPRA